MCISDVCVIFSLYTRKNTELSLCLNLLQFLKLKLDQKKKKKNQLPF